MPDFRCLTTTQKDRVLDVAVRWPEPAGALDAVLLEDLDQLITWIEDEGPCDLLVLRFGSEGSQGKTLEAPSPALDLCRRWEKLLVRIDRLLGVSVAVVDGPCVRFAMQLALACDHRVTSSRTTFQVLELKEGYLPGMNVFRLAKYVGIGVARRLVFTGEVLDAKGAQAIGVVDRVCDASAIDAEVDRLLASLSPVHPVAAQLARRLLGESFSTAFEEFIGQYFASQHRCLGREK
jgi:enoyl-CoA hydratase/carnithine racemase